MFNPISHSKIFASLNYLSMPKYDLSQFQVAASPAMVQLDRIVIQQKVTETRSKNHTHQYSSLKLQSIQFNFEPTKS